MTVKSTCLVIGGSGFLGQNLVCGLLEHGYPVRVLARRPQAEVPWANDLGQRLEWFVGDFHQDQVVEEVLTGSATVFHLVSSTLPATSNTDPVRDVVLNVGSSVKLLDLCRKAGTKRVIFFSSGGTVYGIPNVIPTSEDQPCNPLSSYGIQKLTIEKYMGLYHHLYGLETVSLRIANPYGLGQRSISPQGFIGVSLNAILHQQEFEIWGDGSVVRDYVHVHDVTRAALLAIETTVDVQAINIGTGVGASLREVVSELERATGLVAKVRYRPRRLFDVPTNILNIDTAKKWLGWSPTIALRQGIEDLVKRSVE
jgi:UDP-glucose 4-epimerase